VRPTFPRVKYLPHPLKHGRVTRRADTIFTVLPSSPHVKKVYLGDAGVLQALSSRLDGPRFFVDSTTLDVQVARHVAEQVTATGGQIVDAPVSGGEHFLLEGVIQLPPLKVPFSRRCGCTSWHIVFHGRRPLSVIRHCKTLP
jgi:NAD binding domain of 6-phosphogluconate dehydrogenase